jgi:hypothetical protein
MITFCDVNLPLASFAKNSRGWKGLITHRWHKMSLMVINWRQWWYIQWCQFYTPSQMAITIGNHWRHLNGDNGITKWRCDGKNHQQKPLPPLMLIETRVIHSWIHYWITHRSSLSPMDNRCRHFRHKIANGSPLSTIEYRSPLALNTPLSPSKSKIRSIYGANL